MRRSELARTAKGREELINQDNAFYLSLALWYIFQVQDWMTTVIGVAASSIATEQNGFARLLMTDAPVAFHAFKLVAVPLIFMLGMSASRKLIARADYDTRVFNWILRMTNFTMAYVVLSNAIVLLEEFSRH